MGFPHVALGPGSYRNGLKVNRTVIAAQTTPTAIKTVSGVIHGWTAINESTTSLAAVKYFTSASSTLGVTTNLLAEFFIPAGVSSSTLAFAATSGFPSVGIPAVGGIHIAASTGAIATGSPTNVAANTVLVYTYYV